MLDDLLMAFAMMLRRKWNFNTERNCREAKIMHLATTL